MAEKGLQLESLPQQETVRLHDDAERGVQGSETRLKDEATVLSRLNDASSRLWRMSGLQAGLDEMLAATIELLGADFGNVQLLDAEQGVLRIAAQRGFKPDFLEFFREVTTEDDWACGRALRENQRTIIADVELDAPYAPLRNIARAAGYRAVQSTPLIGRDGAPLGILSTHWASPHRPSEQDLRRLDLYARQAADFIERVRTDQALRESEERFRAYVTASSDVVYRMSADWKEMRHLTGREFIADTLEPSDNWIDKYIHPDDRAQVTAKINEAIRTRGIFELEHRVIRVDGTLGWTFSRAVPLMDEKGEILEWFVTASDVTDRKRAAEALRASEEKYRTLFDSIDEGFCTIEVLFDQAGRPFDYVFLEANEAFITQTGLQNAIGKTILELSPQHEHSWFEIYGEIASTGEAKRFQHRADALTPPRFYDVYAFRIGEPEQRKVAVLFNDITASKQTEMNLALLAEISQDLVRLTTVDEIMETLGAKIGRFFGVKQCIFAEPGDAFETSIVADGWKAEGAASSSGTYRTRDFLSDELMTGLRTGEPLVVRETQTDVRVNAAIYGGLGIRSLIVMPLVREGELRFQISIIDDKPRDWRNDEIELMREMSNRIWTRLESSRSEAALHQSKARFDIVRDSTQVGFWFCDLPFDKLIWDNRVKEHFWLPPDAEVTIDTFYERLHPDDRERTRQAIDESIANRTQYEIEYRTLSSTEQEKWIRAIGRTYYDALGSPIRFDGVTLDITDIKKAEEALRESEARFRNMADHAPVMIWVTETDATCTYLSQSWYDFTGQTPETGLGLGWLDATHPDDRTPSEQIFLAANEKHEAFRLEYRLRRVDGSYAWAIDSATPRFSPTGEFLGFIGSVIDITERRQMEDALREADQRKDEFLAMLAHELRNPLAPIRNAAQVLRLIGPADANQQRACEVIQRQTQHLARLVDDLLDVSRITQGKIKLQRELLDITTIINRAVEASRPLVEARRHQLTVMLPPEAVRLDGDLTRLVQVVSNLVNNAAKYTDEGGHIHITAEAVAGEALIRVRDDGMGISANLLPQVFDMFTQADNSLDRSQGGLGVGLTLVRRLIELHGGRVEAHSEGPGRGSEFIIRLPLAQVKTSGPGGQRTEVSASEADGRARLRILVVEDNIDSAEMLGFILNHIGHETRLIYDGAEVFDAARAFQPQVILCDIGLPGINGYEVARKLRAEPEFKGTRLIALSGYGKDEDRILAKESGFDFHLVKPVDPDTLASLLESMS